MDQSPFYLTEPVDYPVAHSDKDWFVNGVVRIQTEHDPMALFGELFTIQLEEGRMPGALRFGPRILDMDILLYDDIVIESPDLVIPHPRMHKRRFVLRPICDIDPEVVHPVLQKSMRQLLSDLDDNAQRVVICE
jgi:2-amino-4-hydroxy-6-hydroxymethyldihydropteridine diphosphokinase